MITEMSPLNFRKPSKKGVSCAAYNKGVNRNVRRPQNRWLLQQRRRPELFTQGWISSTQALEICVLLWELHSSVMLRSEDWQLVTEVSGKLIGPTSRVMQIKYQTWVRGILLGSKGGRCIGLTTLPPSCTDCHEQRSSISWNPQDLSRPVQGSLYIYLYDYIQILWLFVEIISNIKSGQPSQSTR
jgi:hypothetical protein